jgi:hypothetical protein
LVGSSILTLSRYASRLPESFDAAIRSGLLILFKVERNSLLALYPARVRSGQVLPLLGWWPGKMCLWFSAAPTRRCRVCACEITKL